MVVMGAKDPDFKDPKAEMEKVAESVRGAHRLIEKAGHYPHAEMPDAMLAAILPFLTSVCESARRSHAA
jgi:hypothetical protein